MLATSSFLRHIAPVNFNVAAMIKRTGHTRRKQIVLPAIMPPVGLQRDLKRLYMQVVREWGRQAYEEIMPAYTRTLGEGVRDSVDDVKGEMDEAAEALNRLVLRMDADLEDWVVRVERWHRERFRQLFTPSGVRLDTMLGAGDVRTTLQAVLAENTALIRSVNTDLHNGISGAVYRGLSNRTAAADVTREIRRLTGLATNRAELIASDQLQKLTGRLDRERQEQAGIKKFQWAHSRKKRPRPEHVARDGKIYSWNEGIGLSDPPGRAIRCGCRARAVVDLDEIMGGEAGAAQQPVAEPERLPPPVPPPPRPPRPAPAPAAPQVGFRSPIRPNVNVDTIQVQRRLDLQRELRVEFERANADARYQARHEFGDRRDADFGNATFSAPFDDEAVSMIRALKPELDDLADQIGIPRLRGFKSISGSKSMANQGDGVMGLNPSYFNSYAARVGGRQPGGALAEIEGKRAALAEQMRPIVERIQAVRARQHALPGGIRDPQYQALWDELEPLLGDMAKLRAQDDKLWRRAKVLERGQSETRTTASTWRPGDDVKGRPFGAQAYQADGVDQARTVLFHEFGHHVHQYLQREGPRRIFGTPKLERELRTHFRQAMNESRDRQLSKYSMTNEHEWFAENFTAFVMGRRDLVDPVAKELIERIFRREF